VSYHHDEFGWEVPEALAEGLARLGERSVVKAGEHFKLRVPLAAEGKVGDNWKDVH
jgi:DNA polymerase I-like protein with 3'-5' exonuclease and polymerase domains